MGQIRHADPVKLFIGILTAFPELVDRCGQLLDARYGRVDVRRGPYPFDFTSYYDASMGTPLERHFLSFSDLIEPERLAEIKIETNEIEGELARQDARVARPVNLDPGYLEPAKVVLASTKNFYHRILISSGIYAEVTLHFEKGAWQSFPWTFPDYRSRRYDEFFSEIRTKYRRQISCSG